MALGGGTAALVTLAIPTSALPPALLAAAAAAAAGVGILLSVVMIWSLFVQARLGKAFRAQAALAREAWEVSEPTTRALPTAP